MTGEVTGLRDDELEGTYGWLAAYATLVIAVSGGPDSMALLASLARWQANRGSHAPRLEAVTIDHGLRPESASEARAAGVVSRRLGVAHRIERWEGCKPGSAIQEAARQARYRLLAQAARRCPGQPAAIVTAHHAEDQAETVLMRLARGSGVDGLAAMSLARLEGDVPVLRPLLAIAKARLVATAVAAGIDPVDDPSNADLAFERVRLRAAWPTLEAAGLSAAMIGRSARRLERARRALETATEELAERVVDNHDGAYATIDKAGWLAASDELRIRLLAALVQAHGGQALPARLSQIEALAAALDGGAHSGLTLGGCVVIERQGRIEIFRESGRDGLPEVEVPAGGEACWDRRFQVTWLSPGSGHVLVRALGEQQAGQLRGSCRDGHPARRTAMPALAAATLPSFWRDGRLIAVPHLGIGPASLGLAGPTGDEACLVRFVGQARGRAGHAAVPAVDRRWCRLDHE